MGARVNFVFKTELDKPNIVLSVFSLGRGYLARRFGYGYRKGKQSSKNG